MSGGAIGVMTASWTYHGSEDNSTVLYGTKGVMHIYEDKDYAIKVQLKGGEEIAYKLDEIQTNDNQTSSGVIDEFIHCIKAGTLPRLSAEEALYAMRAVFASITSSKTGQTIKLEP
jgi:predicted dehydrogenase